MSRVALLLLCLMAAVCPLSKTYDLVPYRGCIGLQENGEAGVAQYYRNTLDSLTFVWFWVGDTLESGHFQVSIRDSVTSDLVAQTRNAGSHASRCWTWLPCTLVTTLGRRPVRGRTYKITVSRQYGAAISYAYDPRETTYAYGYLIVGSQTYRTEDLVLRVYGVRDGMDPSYWTAEPMLPDPHWQSAYIHKWQIMADSAGLGAVRFGIAWDKVQPVSLESYSFGRADSDLAIYASANLRWYGLLNGCAESASSREDTTLGSVPYRTSNCAPRGLFHPVGSDSNLWARYLKKVVTHFDVVCDNLGVDKIHTWEIWNEPNDTCRSESLHVKPYNVTGYWRRPNLDSAYPGLDTGLRPLCSLYVRLCEVAESVIHHSGLAGHGGDTILIGALARVTDSSTSEGLVSGKTWLRTCYNIATHGNSVPPFWNGVSVHAYQWQDGFDSAFKANADTLRAIMRDYRHVGPLWCTEIGWRKERGESTNACNLCKTFVASKASEALPEGEYDRVCWWLFREGNDSCDHVPLLDAAMANPYASFYALRQVTRALTSRRYNEPVMNGDTAVDNHTRMYEFEDPGTLRRTWVCWKDGDAKQSIEAKLPVRTDRLAAESLAYSSTTPAFTPRVADDGWLRTSLDVRPVFIHEVGSPERPDLKVDSVRFEPARRVARAWATNHGTKATPVRSGLWGPYPTWAVLKAEGDSLAQVVRRNQIEVGQQVEFTFDLSRTQLPDTALFSVTANPSQAYSELGMDDNTGYTLAVQP